jgi:hypothetical protein
MMLEIRKIRNPGIMRFLSCVCDSFDARFTRYIARYPMSADIRKIVEKGTKVTGGKKAPVCLYFINMATAKLNNNKPK